MRSALAIDGRPTDIGVATTGVAGPDGEGGRAPGTVFVGVSIGEADEAIELSLSGSRAEIRDASVAAAVSALAERIL